VWHQPLLDQDWAQGPGVPDLLVACQDGLQTSLCFRKQVVDARSVVPIGDRITVSTTNVSTAVKSVDLLQDAYLDALDARYVLVCLRVSNDVGDVEVDHWSSGARLAECEAMQSELADVQLDVLVNAA
jgi:hypothetical protein